MKNIIILSLSLLLMSCSTTSVSLNGSEKASPNVSFVDIDKFDRDLTASLVRKLPHQVDNSKLEIPVLNVLGMNSMGVLSPRESWGLNSL